MPWATRRLRNTKQGLNDEGYVRGLKGEVKDKAERKKNPRHES